MMPPQGTVYMMWNERTGQGKLQMSFGSMAGDAWGYAYYEHMRNLLPQQIERPATGMIPDWHGRSHFRSLVCRFSSD